MTGQAARRISNRVDVAGRSFEGKIASGSDEFEQAFLLLAPKYQAKGYDNSRSKLFRVTPVPVLPPPITVAPLDGAPVAGTFWSPGSSGTKHPTSGWGGISGG